MLINMMRYIALVALFGGFGRWQVRWNSGSPTAVLPNSTYIRIENGLWVADERDIESVTQHHSLGTVVNGIWTRLDWCMQPLGYVSRWVQAMRGAINVRVLLYVLKDDAPWEHSIWKGPDHSETTYRNSAGWIVKHYSSGGIQAENKQTWARLAYITTRWSGYWFVKSGYPQDNCDDQRKYPLGANVPNLLLAFRGIGSPRSNGSMVKRIKRLSRMAPMWLRGDITFDNFKLSINHLEMKAVCLTGGGMMFCDREDEKLFFQED